MLVVYPFGGVHSTGAFSSQEFVQNPVELLWPVQLQPVACARYPDVWQIWQEVMQADRRIVEVSYDRELPPRIAFKGCKWIELQH